MNYLKYRFTLDMQSSVSQVSIPARRYDTGIKLLINLANGGSPYVITDGCRAVFAGKKADGKTILNDCIIENNKTIVYKFTQQTTSCEGIVNCEIRLYGKGGDMLTNPKFIIVVDERVFHDEEMPLSDHEKPIIDNIIISETERIEAETIRTEAEESRVEAENNRVEAENNREAAIEEFKTAVENGEFDGRGINWRGAYVPGTSYARADAVYYNGSSYICIIGNAIADPTTTAFWSLLAKGGENSSGGVSEESDPTVPKWAKQQTKPAYDKSEVGLGNVDNVKQYSAENEPPYPVTSVNNKTGAVSLSASDVGARPSTWTPSYSDVGADKSGTADSTVSTHNVNAESHNDIRLLISGLSERVNALLNSDDTTLDETKEIVAYIKANKALIDSITTSKVNASDIINNLTTNVANKPLSAAQGVVIKAFLDAKLDSSKLAEAITTALAEAKASGKFDGSDGRGIKSIARTSGNGAAGTTDTYTITYTDNTTSTYTVYNGKDGKTPVKGTDYFTPEDVAEIVSEVLSNFTDVSEVAI